MNPLLYTTVVSSSHYQVRNPIADIHAALLFFMQVDTEQELNSLATTLEKEGKDFKLWVEQPENYPTCLATKPYPKTDIQKYFRKYKLLS